MAKFKLYRYDITKNEYIDFKKTINAKNERDAEIKAIRKYIPGMYWAKLI